MVICTLLMRSRFHSGSKMELVNRRNRMSMAGSLPRKWSMRMICHSSSSLRRSAFRARADARSWPNGFSTTTRARAVRPAPARPSTTRPKSDGGISR